MTAIGFRIVNDEVNNAFWLIGPDEGLDERDRVLYMRTTVNDDLQSNEVV